MPGTNLKTIKFNFFIKVKNLPQNLTEVDPGL